MAEADAKVHVQLHIGMPGPDSIATTRPLSEVFQPGTCLQQLPRQLLDTCGKQLGELAGLADGQPPHQVSLPKCGVLQQVGAAHLHRFIGVGLELNIGKEEVDSVDLRTERRHKQGRQVRFGFS